MGKLAEHLVQVADAASLSAGECTGLVFRLEKSDEHLTLRNALPDLITNIRELGGTAYSLQTTLNNLALWPRETPGIRNHWDSDLFYLRESSRVLDDISGRARAVPGFETSPRDAVSNQHISSSDGPPSAPPLSPLNPKTIQIFKFSLARLNGRLATGISALDMYRLHCAVSQIESVREPPGAISDSLPTHPPEQPSIITTKCHLNHLIHPSENRYPSLSYADELMMVEARNKTKSAYSRAATAWITPLVNKEWETIREPVLSLFGFPRAEPPRANFIQWVLEFCRQNWPSHFADRPHRGQVVDVLATFVTQNPKLAPLAVAAALGLYKLCREHASWQEDWITTPEWSVLLQSALLGPSALLKTSTLSTWERISEAPHSIDQAKTIRAILTHGFAPPNGRLLVDTPQPTHLDCLAFFVSLRLREPDLLMAVICVCSGPSDDLKDLLQPGPLWAVAASRHELCASEESRECLTEILSRLLAKIFPTSEEETHPFSDLFEGAYKLALDLDLPFAARGLEWYQAAVPDSRFAEEVRGFVRDKVTLAIRCLSSDPRWDCDLPYEDDNTSDGSYGGTILHRGVEASSAHDFEILEIIVQSGANLDKTDNRGRTALMLCEEAPPFRFLVQSGADTRQRDIDGSNFWHFAAANAEAHTLTWLFHEDPHADENIRVANAVGFTPLTEAIFSTDGVSDNAQEIDCILFLCSVSSADPACLQAPSPLMHEAVKWGSEEIVRELLRLGVDPNQPVSDGSSPLHNLNLSASLGMIRLLLDVCTGLPIQRPADQRTPLEAMFLDSDSRRIRLKLPNPTQPASPFLDAAVATALLTPEVLASRDDRSRGLWERFCRDIVTTWEAQSNNHHIFSVLQVAVQEIARSGALKMYEEETGHSGIPLFYLSTQRTLDAWPADILMSIYRVLLLETSRLGSFMDGPEALQLAGTAVAANSVEFLDMLLAHGICVHQRPPGNGGPPKRTLLEIACAPGSRTSVAVLERLLAHTSAKHLDDVDDTLQGLIHHLIVPSPGRDLKLSALLDKGANPNLMRWGRSPALVSYILERQHDAAMILLDKGADPAQTTKDGMDAALAAASRGSLQILEKIKSLVPSDYDWQRTCKSHFTIIHPGGAQVTTTASNCNALHLAAFNSFDIIVQFYCFNFKIDVNHAIVDNLHRPIHLAAISGSASCIRVLHEHGADLAVRARDGFTPLHTAVRSSQAQAVKTLLELGDGSLNMICDNEGLTPFVHALQIGFPSIIRLFTDVGTFKVGGSPSAARSRFVGQTIDSAIRSGDLTQCKNLLAVTSLADFETCPLRCGGCTPVILAIREAKPAVLRWLLDQKCTGFTGSCPAHFRRHAQTGFDALNSLCENRQLNEGGLEPLLAAYLYHRIDWTSASISPIHTATRANNLDAIKTILRHVSMAGNQYRSRFCFEASSPRPTGEAVPLSELIAMKRHVLNQRVTMPNAFDFCRGWTPLHIAASIGNSDIAAFLLEQGVDVDVEDEAHDTPLHLAVRNGHELVARMLLLGGAHSSRAHGQGFAPLMAAVEAGNVGMAETFVAAGADTGVVDMDGMSLLNIAGERPKTPAMFHYLLRLGLDPYARDKAGYMAFDDMMLNFDMLGYALNQTFDFEKMEELNKGLFSLVVELNRADSVSMLKRLFRRLPRARVEAMINFVPERFVSALCTAVYRDVMGAVDVLVRHGADVNLEGCCTYGSALMVACSRGRLESVRALISHGARVAYVGPNGRPRSAVDAAEKFPEVQQWLLVGRHAERRALMPRAADTPAHVGARENTAAWSGTWKVAYRLQGTFAEHRRSPRECRAEYLARTAELRRSFSGRVLKGVELVRPSSGRVKIGEVSVWDVERRAVPLGEGRGLTAVRRGEKTGRGGKGSRERSP